MEALKHHFEENSHSLLQIATPPLFCKLNAALGPLPPRFGEVAGGPGKLAPEGATCLGLSKGRVGLLFGPHTILVWTSEGRGG